MRISDWSSDVCSSDLCGRHTGLYEVRHRKAAFGLWGQARPGAALSPVPRVHGRQEVGEEEPRKAPREIGRASCRERGWPVRVDLGGRSFIKKQKNNTHTYTTTTHTSTLHTQKQ